jgi:ArsR family transcriptional regulator, arsenate/arsenite/antimonite-responsive transcriptional repressor
MEMADDDLAAVMRALGHPVRLSILKILAERQSDCCCMDVTECLPLAQSTVSQHIKALADASAGLFAGLTEPAREPA